jgi:hypothetical protein
LAIVGRRAIGHHLGSFLRVHAPVACCSTHAIEHQIFEIRIAAERRKKCDTTRQLSSCPLRLV